MITLVRPPDSNSVEIHAGFASMLSLSNIGAGFGVFKNTSGGVSFLKTLVASSGISIVNNTNDLTLSIDPSYINSLITTQLGAGINLVTANRVAITNGSSILSVSPVTSTELLNLSGSSSNIQTQLNGKQETVTGAASTITSLNLSSNFALISDGSGKVAVSPVTATELSLLSGASSNIQTQINTINTTLSGVLTTPLATDLEIIYPYSLKFKNGLSTELTINAVTGITAQNSLGIVVTNGQISSLNGPGFFGGGWRTSMSGPNYLIKTVNIGAWNMASFPSWAVIVPGIFPEKVRFVFANIVADNGTQYYNLSAPTLSGVAEGGVQAIWPGGVTLYRTTGGGFDSTFFDTTGFNRGWVTVIYEA